MVDGMCQLCGRELPAPSGPGRPRRYCDAFCARTAKTFVALDRAAGELAGRLAAGPAGGDRRTNLRLTLRGLIARLNGPPPATVQA